ncbi:hypothetical protein PFUM301598_22530 [Pseudomonas fluorescens]
MQLLITGQVADKALGLARDFLHGAFDLFAFHGAFLKEIKPDGTGLKALCPLFKVMQRIATQ